MEAGESEDPGTKTHVPLTGMGTGIPEEIVVPVERGGDIRLMDPGPNPQLRERSPTREKRPMVTGKNDVKIKSTAQSIHFTLSDFAGL